MLYLKRIGQNLNITISLAFLIGLILVAFLYPVLSKTDLDSAYHQNPRLIKLYPLSEVRFLKVVQNKTRRDDEDVFRYVPYDQFDIIGDQVLVQFQGRHESIHVVDVLYPITDQELTKIESQHISYSFRDITQKQVNTNLKDMVNLLHQSALMKKRFVLGTDQLGRDMLSRILAGGRISIALALLAVIISIFVGVGIGLLAGYFGGWIDRLTSWILGLFWSVPSVLFVVIIAMMLDSARAGVVFGITFVLWVEMAQVVKSKVQEISRKEYVLASRLIGLSNFTILRRHILPNVTAPIFVLATTAFSEALVLEAGLSFIGVGISPPHPSWGNMIRTTYGYMLTEDYAYMMLFPSIMLFLVVLAAVILSHGIKRELDLLYVQQRNPGL
jgi:peptide/nickel transport system permease protein